MQSSLLYAACRIKSQENNLITEDRLVRMLDSRSFEEAVKILQECNYGDGFVLNSYGDYEALLSAEKDSVTKLIREIATESSGVDVFLVKNDYHNAKAILKGIQTGQENLNDIAYMLLPNGLITAETISDAVSSKNFVSLYKDMADALKFLTSESLNHELSPRVIDTVLDKAMFSDILNRVKKCRCKQMKEYVLALLDLTNISTLLRCKMNGINISVLKESFIEGGTYSVDEFVKLYDSSFEAVSDKLRYSPYGSVVLTGTEGAAKKNLSRFEAETDNYLLSIFKKEKNNIFSPAVIAGFYLAKLTEIKAARIIIVCLKNNVDKDIIKQRLRELYV